MTQAVQSLPLDRMDLAPDYLKQRPGAYNVDRYYPGSPNGAGMYPRPPGYHGGWDIFAPENSAVRAPFTGRIVNVSPSVGSTGSVYGGTIGVESDDGPCVILRHIVPELVAGTRVEAGQRIARVSPWSGGATHAHMECYPRWPSAYAIAAAVDPGSWTWVESLPDATPEPRWFVEDMPHNKGGTGPVTVRRTRSRAVALASVAQHKALGRLVSTMRDGAGVLYVLWWLPGTHRDGLPVFGPGTTEAWAVRTRNRRTKNRGYPVRIIRGRENSLYPTPA